MNFIGNPPPPIVSYIALALIYAIAKIDIYKIKNALIAFSCVLLLMNFGLVAQNTAKIVKQNIEANKYANDISSYITQKSDKNRDIYIIVLDMYSGTDILKQKWGFDNSEFINFLKNKGFYVFDKMYSNYNVTFSSIPTMTNFDYIEDTDYANTSIAISNAMLFSIAKYNDFKTILVNGGNFNIKSANIDYVLHSINGKNHETILLMFFRNFLWKSLIEKFVHWYNHRFKTTEFGFKKEAIKKIGNKKLVFIHIMKPHEPFLYDENGKDVPVSNINDKDNCYLPYLKYVNKKTMEFIEEIFQDEQDNLPVIIVTGDHGMRHPDYYDSNFSTFTAYFNPEKKYNHIINTKTLINFFINFSNYELNTNIQNREDKIIYTSLGINGLPSNENNIIKLINEYGIDETKRYIK